MASPDRLVEDGWVGRCAACGRTLVVEAARVNQHGVMTEMRIMSGELVAVGACGAQTPEGTCRGRFVQADEVPREAAWAAYLVGGVEAVDRLLGGP